MTITAITSAKNDPNRFHIFIDGVYSFSTDQESLFNHRFRVGGHITAVELPHLKHEAEFTTWYGRVLRFLGRRPRSQQEIVVYLTRRNVDEGLQRKLIHALSDKKLLDDQAFAQWFIEQRQQFRPRGRRFLRAELKQKGIPDSILDQSLNNELDSKTEKEAARQIVAKKRQRLQGASSTVRRQKLTAALVRRGFSWDSIKEALKGDTLDL